MATINKPPLGHLEDCHPQARLADDDQDISYKTRCEGLGATHRG